MKNHLIIATVLLCLCVIVPASYAGLIASDSSSNSITLHWTAPGDDGGSGTASQYDVRYSLSNITDANFATATQAINEPAPGAGGTAETFTVSGLLPGTIYYFAIKTADEVPNWSALSNIAIETTSQESIAPSNVVNLATSNATGTSIRLTWTAPGDDSTSGTASQYDIRYSTSPITGANWAAATQVTGEPTPLIAGTQQTYTVTGLQSGRTYYFAMKTADEVPNWSGLSNVPSGSTLDTVPPAAITDLHVEIDFAPALSQSVIGIINAKAIIRENRTIVMS
jgi:phosphodiesterase/alkaline phosphatase D-like protein